MRINYYLVVLLLIISGTTAYSSPLPPPESYDELSDDGSANFAVTIPGGGYSDVQSYSCDFSGGDIFYIYWPKQEIPHGSNPDIFDFQAQSQIVAALCQAVQKFRTVLREQGPTPSAPLTIAIIKEAYLEPTNVVMSRPDQRLPTNALFSQSKKMLLLSYYIMQESDCAPVTIAHELAHVFEFYMNNKQAYNNPYRWLTEGGATYMASLVFDENSYFECFDYHYINTGVDPRKPLFKTRDYDAYSFFRYIHQEKSQQTAVNLFKKGVKKNVNANQLVEDFGLKNLWSKFATHVWTDQKFRHPEAQSDCLAPRHADHDDVGTPETLNKENLHTKEYIPDSLMQPFSTRYDHYYSEHSQYYKVFLNEIYKNGQNKDFHTWAIVTAQNGTKKIVDITGEESVLFFPGQAQGQGQDHRLQASDTEKGARVIYHKGEDLVLAFSCVANPDTKCSGIEAKEYQVVIGLSQKWTLGQIRLNEGDKKGINKLKVIGKMTMTANIHPPGVVRLKMHTKHFWPNFSARYYHDAIKQHPDSKIPFKAGDEMEKFIEHSCWFAGQAELEITGLTEDEWSTHVEDRPPLLKYKLKLVNEPIHYPTAHRFRCKPNFLTSKNAAPMLFGGIGAGSVSMVETTKWLKAGMSTGYGLDSWAQQLQEIFMQSLLLGVTGNQEEEITLAYQAGEEDNYLIIKINDQLKLIFTEQQWIH